MSKLVVGHRYMSEAEPELGLGVLSKIEGKTVILSFQNSEEIRRYGMQSAPVKRISFEKGDEVSSNDGKRFIVQDVFESENGLLVYIGESESEIIVEIDLLDTISYHHPEEKLINNRTDSLALFNLRYETLKHRSWLSAQDFRGFIGGRLTLIPHQLYLANEISKRQHPRVLLADEVGLGKTIEAGLIIQRLLITGRIERTLVVVPNTLCYQWFLEMLRKYNLSFTVVNEQTELEIGANPFEENNLVITSLQLLCGSEVAQGFMMNAKWDMLVIDEAHKIDWKKDQENPIYETVEELTKKIPSLLLLTATPEMAGLEGHFARLKLIDPKRFHSYEIFLEEYSHLKEMANLGKRIFNEDILNEADKKLLSHYRLSEKNPKELLQALIDRHGTGRSYFRNTRKVMEDVFDFFPKRILHPVALNFEGKKKYKDIESDENFQSPSYLNRIEWLVNFLEENSEKKVLLICRSKKKIIRIEKDLKELTINNKVSVFHSDLSLMARDRQAAYFSDPEGANILLCTEIGSEGRNFEFAHDLILFDLPSNPDLLEQRIGRLDRIGQTANIQIHVPYLTNSWEEILFHWYHHGLHVFQKLLKRGIKIYEQFQSELEESFEQVKVLYSEDKKRHNDLIERTKTKSLEIEKELDEGRDILVELNSYRSEEATDLVNKIRHIDENERLKIFLENVFTHFGVDVEDLDGDSQYVKPGHNMFVPHFPHLNEDGFSYTYNRQKALEREELSFMSWDHPMVVEVMDLIAGEEFGNVTVATRKNSNKSNPYFETFFLLESHAPKRLEVARFLPPTIIRVLINLEGEDFGDKWSKEMLDEKLREADNALKIKISKLPKERIKQLLQEAQVFAEEKSHNHLMEARKKVSHELDGEVFRLEELRKINPSISDNEILFLQDQKEQILQSLNTTTLGLDCFRFIY